MKYQAIMDSPVGKLLLMEEDGALIKLSFRAEYRAEAEVKKTDVLKQAERELREYFNGARKRFTVPLKFSGTPFQIAVWEALLRIPYGEVRSYRQIAEMTGSKKAYRAVGQAVHNNPVVIMIPCHRVIASDGSIGGFAEGIELKMKLLSYENVKM